MARSREEQETIIRFDETDAEAYLWTASRRQAGRWQRAGCVLKTKPGGWSGRVPKAAVSRMRRLVVGQVLKRETGFSLRNAHGGVGLGESIFLALAQGARGATLEAESHTKEAKGRVTSAPPGV